ncbi:MAG: hypothetical protein ABIJ75_04345 [Actinomycetota bacterium]
MDMKARMAGLVAIALVATACNGGGSAGVGGPDLQIERRSGFAVIVDESADTIEIGFSADRDSESGEAFDVTAALWRIGDGPWNEPPVTCISKGQRLEMGISSIQNEARPGLLKERVIWVSCLPPTDG